MSVLVSTSYFKTGTFVEYLGNAGSSYLMKIVETLILQTITSLKNGVASEENIARFC